MRLVWGIVGGIALTLLVLGALTWAALEMQEVVVIRTGSPDGTVRETRIWIADEDGSWWLEAASAESPWYRDVLANRSVEIVRGGRTVEASVTPVPGEDGHRKIRRLFRQKYGLADLWIGLIQDGSGSILIRAEPVAE
jgi:hypothetical protein